MTKSELNRLTEVSLTNIARIEQGKGNTTIYTLAKIAKALDCDISEILPRGLK